ncbi:MAG: putative membrane-bound metal-dependent [Rhodospirillaceae bacterium]|nr:MAG: putative membrane-bound metal-dependent [Rhodospirillaceae bacterium]TNC94100.1 MAG: putative membrane-bound metal-dependent hydrolase [Stygiobacter sp.]
MMAGSHIAVGAALWAVTARLSGLEAVDPQSLAAAALGALLPDIDHPHSWAGRKVRFISVPLSLLLGHRGLTHSALAVLAGAVLLAIMGTGWLAAPVVVGYLSHLLADGLTPSGVPLLWPHKRRFSLNLCRTGSVTEIAIVAVITIVGGWAAGIDLSHLPRPKL